MFTLSTYTDERRNLSFVNERLRDKDQTGPGTVPRNGSLNQGIF